MRTKLFNLEAEIDALEKAFKEDGIIIHGLSVNPENNVIEGNIVLHIASVVPVADTLEGGTGPHEVSLQVWVFDPLNNQLDQKRIVEAFDLPEADTSKESEERQKLIARRRIYHIKGKERVFYEKYYFPIRNALQNLEWLCHGAVSGLGLDEEVVYDMRMNFTKTIY